MGPNELDWDLKLLDASHRLRYIIIPNCNIGGTLPDFANHSELVYLLASESKLSGTMTDAMFANTSGMSSLDLGNSKISGTLPHTWGSHRQGGGNSFEPDTLLLHNCDVSGTLTDRTWPLISQLTFIRSLLYSIDSTSPLIIYCIACFIGSSSTIDLLS